MTNLVNKSTIISLIASSAIFSGCSTNMNDVVDSINPFDGLEKNSDQDKLVIYESNDANEEMSERNIINMDLPKKSMTAFTKSDIIIEDIGDDVYPPKELLEVVDGTVFNNQKLGDIIKILTSNFKNTSVIFEPNIDMNIQVYMRTGKMKLYHLIKQITKNAGYYASYNPHTNSLNISPFQTRKYRVPAGLFVKKTVEQTLGHSQGTANAQIDLNSESPIDSFNNQLKMLGSSDKLINFDRSSGTLIVKEHPIYLSEIDDFVVDFVQDRSRKFIVETAIFDVVLTKDRSVGLDLENFSTAGLNPLSINNLGGSGSGMVVSAAQKLVGSVFNPDGTPVNPGYERGESFNVVLSMMKKNKNSILVDKSKTIISNHDVNYIGNGSSINYIESIEPIINESGTTTYVPKSAKAFDGITFVTRVDGFRNKDYIEVSLAPSVKNVTIERGGGAAINGVIAADLVNEEIREAMSTVNIKNGEVIVLGGLIREEDIGTESRNPLLEDIPYIRNLLGTKGTGKVRIETVFVVKVKELHRVEQSYEIPSYKIKGEIENRF